MPHASAMRSRGTPVTRIDRDTVPLHPDVFNRVVLDFLRRHDIA